MNVAIKNHIDLLLFDNPVRRTMLSVSPANTLDNPALRKDIRAPLAII